MIRCDECRAPLEFLVPITDPDAADDLDLPYFTEVWARRCKLLFGTSAGEVVLTMVPPKGRESWAFFGIRAAMGKGDA